MQETLSGSSSETSLAVLVVVAMLVIGTWRFLAWWFRQPVRPDPWAGETLAAENAQPLCLRCLEPHDETAWFCPHCGTPVGEYNNYNPYLYVFSLGEALRTGTSGPVPRRFLSVAGYVLLSASEYFILAPIYWVLLILNLCKKKAPPPLPPPLTPT